MIANMIMITIMMFDIRMMMIVVMMRMMMFMPVFMMTFKMMAMTMVATMTSAGLHPGTGEPASDDLRNPGVSQLRHLHPATSQTSACRTAGSKLSNPPPELVTTTSETLAVLQLRHPPHPAVLNARLGQTLGCAKHWGLPNAGMWSNEM